MLQCKKGIELKAYATYASYALQGAKAVDGLLSDACWANEQRLPGEDRQAPLRRPAQMGGGAGLYRS
jgi:hypothetical protein